MQPAKAAKSFKGSEVKALSSVKTGAVTKSSQTPKSKSKELAKQVAAKSQKGDKKSKKVVKEPSPELSSDDDSEDDSDASMTSGSSADSDEESGEDVSVPAAKANGVASNGVAKAVEAETSDSSESSDSDAEAAPLAPSAATKNADVAVGSDEDSSDASGESSGAESDVESEADSSDDDKADVKAGAPDAEVLNGKLEKVASKEVCPTSPPIPTTKTPNVLFRMLQLNLTTTIPPMPRLKKACRPTRMIRAIQMMKNKKRHPPRRSVRLMPSLRLLPKRPRPTRWLAALMMPERETSSSAIFPGT